MKRMIRIIVGLLVLMSSAAIAPAQLRVAGRQASRLKAVPFRLDEVRLLESPFKTAMNLDAEVLLKLNADRLLHNFRENAGLAPKGEKYGGWETMTIAGHTLGHYLSALSMHYASTGDRRFLERINYIVSELNQCQEADGGGYVAGIPGGKKAFLELSEGKIVSKNPFDLNGVWVPWYTMHKLFAGLLDADELAKNRQARQILIRLADWTDRTTAKLTDEQIQKMLFVEQGGMLESLVELASRTGDQKYLELAQRFYHKAVMNPLAEGRGQILEGLHANMQVPKVIGAARLYEVGGDVKNEKVAETFWDEVIDHQTYVNGGNSDKEHFGKRDEIAKRMSGSMTETCNTYNMLKLTRHLFEWNPQSAYFDYYERALYNQILTSQDPKTGLGGYKLGLYGGYFEPFSTLEDSFWCCTGSGFENHVKYNDSIYFHGENELYVNLFIPSTLSWKEKNLILTQETKFPDDDRITLSIEEARKSTFSLKIRRPDWAEKGVEVTVNGQKFSPKNQTGGYIEIERRWKKGDRVEIRYPLTLKLERTPDDPHRIALLDGPIVLAGVFGADNFPPEGPYGKEGSDDWKLPLPKIPYLKDIERPLDEWIKPVAGKSLNFQMAGAGGEKITLVPLFRSQHQRMTVYWDGYEGEQVPGKSEE